MYIARGNIGNHWRCGVPTRMHGNATYLTACVNMCCTKGDALATYVRARGEKT